ncbi:MAG: SDR family oxidoreductase [Candidatus Levybacteria bacterium]|nr:SDR family oxidoreductase [Candidatus Levybacteria bacterium]
MAVERIENQDHFKKPLERTPAMPEKKLSGKVAVVTGGISNIGLGIATKFAEEGATVIVAHRDPNKEPRARKAQERIQENGGVYIPLTIDVSNPEDRKKLVEYIKKEYGHVDIIVHCAAAGLRVKPDYTPEEDENLWETGRAVNCEAKVELNKLFMENNLMPEGSVIIDTPSVGSYVNAKDIPGYDVVGETKNEGENAQRAQIPEFDKRKIGFGFVCGGAITDTTTGKWLKRQGLEAGGQSAEIKDMADAALYLALYMNRHSQGFTYFVGCSPREPFLASS